jgi:hypothetical protein
MADAEYVRSLPPTITLLTGTAVRELTAACRTPRRPLVRSNRLDLSIHSVICRAHGVAVSWEICWKCSRKPMTEMVSPRCKNRADIMSSTTELKKKRQFRKFTYRGIELDQYVNAPCSTWLFREMHRARMLGTP